MTKLTTTLALIKEHDPCEDGLKTLLDYLGKDYPEDKEINLLTILESNGLEHFFWSFRAVEQESHVSNRLAVQLAVAFAERVLHIFEDKYPDDDRPRKSIESAKDYLNASTEEKREAAVFRERAAEAAECGEQSARMAAAAARVAAEWAAGAAAAAREEDEAEWAVWAAAAARMSGAEARGAAWVAWDARAEEYDAQILIIKSFLKD